MQNPVELEQLFQESAWEREAQSSERRWPPPPSLMPGSTHTVHFDIDSDQLRMITEASPLETT